jgi:hypothetical protein
LTAGLLPLGAQAATQCFDQNAPAPLEACMKDDGTPGVWVAQPNGRHHQYYGEYALGSILWAPSVGHFVIGSICRPRHGRSSRSSIGNCESCAVRGFQLVQED